MDALAFIELLIIIIDIVTLIFLFYSERSTPEKVIPWALLFILLPVVGFIIYIFIGQTWYADHTFKIKELNDTDIQNLHNAQINILGKDKEEKYARIAHTLYNLGGIGYTGNNEVKLFIDGHDKFDSLFKDLRDAKKFIHMEYYIIKNDELGNELMDILIQKAKEGLEVKLMTDDLGIASGLSKRIKEFKKSGGEFALFHTIISLALSPKKNNRNHRKIAVIDGTISYCGGFNVGDEYLGKGKLGYWRDTAVRILGIETCALESRFIMDWRYASKIEFTQKPEVYFPEDYTRENWKTRTMCVSGGPDVALDNPIRREYLELIKNAKKSVYLHTPYFVPDDSLKDALILAAASGVDVKVIIPDKPDHMFVYWNNVSSAREVMDGNVKIYQYNNGFVHSKTLVVDGEYCSVGSANFDDRSLVLNFETNVVILDKEIGRQMEEAFLNDLKYCSEYTSNDFDSLSFMNRTRIAVSRLFKNLT